MIVFSPLMMDICSPTLLQEFWRKLGDLGIHGVTVPGNKHPIKFMNVLYDVNLVCVNFMKIDCLLSTNLRFSLS